MTERLATLLLAAFLLSGCGLKGDLYLPEDEPAAEAETAPVETSPAQPAAEAETAPVETSSAQPAANPE